jgi:hypothetical protein
LATVARDSVPITPNADTARVEPITSCGYEQTLLRGATRQQRSQGLSSHPGNTFVLENLDLSFAKASTDAKISPRFPSPFVGMTAPCSRCPFLLIPSLGRTGSGKRSRRIGLPNRNSLLLPVTRSGSRPPAILLISKSARLLASHKLDCFLSSTRSCLGVRIRRISGFAPDCYAAA